MRQLLLLLLLAMPVSAQAVPLTLAHHGQLLDAEGDPITGSETITFRLFDAETEGNEVWSEALSVDVVAGHYAALLSLGTLGRDVLRAEPSLFLELEIDGEVLSPRQSVASTPYAVLADTAENLEGGTVNAAEVLVNGTSVIDGSGTWTGGIGSIGWDAIGDVPAGLDDGDADTLGGLSCASGAVARFDGAAWICASTLEAAMLDTTGASTGDLLQFDGSIAAWVPGSAAGCTMSVLNSATAQLTCGPDTVLIQSQPSFTHVAGGTSMLCTIDSLGVVRCNGAMPEPPQGTFIDVDMVQSTACAVSGAGGIECWAASPGSEVVGVEPAGPFERVWVGEPLSGEIVACGGLASTGDLVCWGGTTTVVQTPPPAGDYVDLEFLAGFDRACGVLSDGSIVCWGDCSTQWSPAGPPSTTGWTSISKLSNGFCVAGAGNSECFSACSTVTPGTWEPAPAISTTIDNAGVFCGLTAAGAVECVDGATDEAVLERAGPFTAVAAVGAALCGVLESDGALTCWGPGVQAGAYQQSP